jgi:hypothetical protein
MRHKRPGLVIALSLIANYVRHGRRHRAVAAGLHRACSWVHAFGEKPVAQMMGNPRSQSLKEVQNSTESWLKLSLQAA